MVLYALGSIHCGVPTTALGLTDVDALRESTSKCSSGTAIRGRRPLGMAVEAVAASRTNMACIKVCDDSIMTMDDESTALSLKV